MRRRANLKAAVIGTRDQVYLLRLAGVEKWRVLEDGPGVGEKVRSALEELLGDSEVAVVAIPETWSGHIEDILLARRRARRFSPAVITVPSGYGEEPMDVRRFYQAYTRQLIGFNIEI